MMNKFKLKSNVVFGYTFAVIFSLIVIGASTVIFKDIYSLFFTALIVFLFMKAKISYNNEHLVKKVRTQIRILHFNRQQLILMAVIVVMAMFIMQLILGYFLISTPVTDWMTIDTIAKNFAKDGNFDNMYVGLPEGRSHYMARYTNNNGILIMLSFYYRAIYLIFGSISTFAPVILNTVFINVSVIFTFLIAKKIFSYKGAFLTLFCCLLFLPYYTYTAYYYSDSLSIPFTVISIYFIIKGQEKIKQNKHDFHLSVIYFCISGIFIAIGFVIKGSILIILVGAVVYIFLCGNIKKTLISIVYILLSTFIFIFSINTFISSMNIVSQEELYAQKFPVQHWLMMGLNGNGGFNQKDASFTAHAGNYDQKKQANIQKIQERISSMGFDGMTKHLYRKLIYTWSDGTYYIQHHLNRLDIDGQRIEDENIFFEFVLNDGQHYEAFRTYSGVYHMCMLIAMCLSGYFYLRKKRPDKITLIHGIIFGVILFFSVWETRSRYLYNFTPLFLITAVDGIILFWNSEFFKPKQHTKAGIVHENSH